MYSAVVRFYLDRQGYQIEYYEESNPNVRFALPSPWSKVKALTAYHELVQGIVDRGNFIISDLINSREEIYTTLQYTGGIEYESRI